MSGVTDGSACTTTVLDATSALTDWTPALHVSLREFILSSPFLSGNACTMHAPSIFPKIRLTAPEQPSLLFK
eukprot:scaffold25204_cov193-Amphora_coffeaeformis.AAC.5